MNAKNANDLLNQFTGTEQYYKHLHDFLYTDGIQYLASKFECYWLLAEIGNLNKTEQILIRNTGFQVWTLQRISPDSEAFTIKVDDGNKNLLFQKEITYSDFKYDLATLWMVDNVLLLPSEY